MLAPSKPRSANSSIAAVISRSRVPVPRSTIITSYGLTNHYDRSDTGACKTPLSSPAARRLCGSVCRPTAPWRRSCPIPRPRGADVAARVDHPLCARLYVRQSEQAKRLGLAARRAQLLDGLAGRVLEVGAGTG